MQAMHGTMKLDEKLSYPPLRYVERFAIHDVRGRRGRSVKGGPAVGTSVRPIGGGCVVLVLAAGAEQTVHVGRCS